MFHIQLGGHKPPEPFPNLASSNFETTTQHFMLQGKLAIAGRFQHILFLNAGEQLRKTA